MEKYTIPVENIEALRAKAEQIAKKAKRYGVTIHYAEVGEEVREEEAKTGCFTGSYYLPREGEQTARKEYHKYIIVEVEGVARANGWEFAGVIEHTEGGNICRTFEGVELPEHFSTCPPYCEHCKTTRRRKDTYLVKNTTTGEIKQVGKNCLKEYTDGLSLEAVGFTLQWLKTCEGFCFYTGDHIPQ